MLDFLISPLKYVYYVFFVTGFLHSFIGFTKLKNTILDTAAFWFSYLLCVFITSLVTIIFINTGFILDLKHIVEYAIIITFFYIIYYFSKQKVLTKREKKYIIVILIAPFLFSSLILQTVFSGNNIYKINKYCIVSNKPNEIVCNYKNGVYTGQLKAFLRHGKGTYKWNSGKVYIGEWKNNLMDGVGEITEKGKTVKGTWKKHQFLNE